MTKRSYPLRKMEADIRRSERILEAQRKLVAILKTVRPQKRRGVILAVAALVGIPLAMVER